MDEVRGDVAQQLLEVGGADLVDLAGVGPLGDAAGHVDELGVAQRPGRVLRDWERRSTSPA